MRLKSPHATLMMTAATALLGVMLLWWLAQLLWLVIAPPRPVILAPLAHVSESNAVHKKFSLFHTQPATTATSLEGVSLLGTIPAQPNHLSRALLSVHGQPAMLAVGDQVGDSGYQLVAVGLYEVKLGDGMSNILSLGMAGMVLDSDHATNASGRIDNISLAKYASSMPNATLDGTAAATDMPARQDLPHTLSAPAVVDATSAAAVMPPPDTGVMLSNMGLMLSSDGYQVTDHAPQQFKESLGLQSGDTIISINGQPLGANPAADAALLHEMGERVQMQVIRSGKVVQIDRQ